VGDCGTRYARYDGGLRVYSGPSALALDPHSGLLWVANLYTDNVVVLRCSGTPDSLIPAVATYRVGRAPRGLALTRDGTSAFVDVGYDHAVSRLDFQLTAGALEVQEPTLPLNPALTVRRALGTSAFSESAQKGRSLFHDAVNTHLTPSGVVTCATC